MLWCWFLFWYASIHFQNVFWTKEMGHSSFEYKWAKSSCTFPTFNDSDILMLCLFADFRPAAHLDPAPRSVSFSFVAIKIIKQSFFVFPSSLRNDYESWIFSDFLFLFHRTEISLPSYCNSISTDKHTQRTNTTKWHGHGNGQHIGVAESTLESTM